MVNRPGHGGGDRRSAKAQKHDSAGFAANREDPPTPETPKHRKRPQRTTYDTPTKAAVQGTVAYMRDRGLEVNETNVFAFNGVSKRSGWRMLETYDGGELKHGPRRIQHDPERIDTRGRPQLITSEHLEKTQDLLVAGWKGLTQSTINDYVESMPLRLHDVIEAHGQMTGW